MGSFMNVLLSLVMVSLATVACNKASDQTAKVGQATGKGSQVAEQEKAKAQAEAQKKQNVPIDTSKLTPEQKRYVLVMAKDIVQIRNMARQMDPLFVALWVGYWTSRFNDGRAIPAVNNVFRLLEVALKSQFNDMDGLPFVSPFQTVAEATKSSPRTAAPVTPQQNRKGKTAQQTKETVVQTQVNDKCRGNVYKMKVTGTDVVDGVALPNMYSLVRIGCSGGQTSEHELAEFKMKVAADGKNRYTEINFVSQNLEAEIGLPLSIFAGGKAEPVVGVEAPIVIGKPACTFNVDEKDTLANLNCENIGQSLNQTVFMAMEKFRFSRKAKPILSGKWIEYVLNDSAKLQKTTEKLIIDSVDTNAIIFREVPLKATEKIVETPAALPPVVTPVPAVAPVAPKAPVYPLYDDEGNLMPPIESGDQPVSGDQPGAGDQSPPLT